MGFSILIDLTQITVFLYEALVTHQAPRLPVRPRPATFVWRQHPYVDGGTPRRLAGAADKIGPGGVRTMISKIKIGRPRTPMIRGGVTSDQRAKMSSFSLKHPWSLRGDPPHARDRVADAFAAAHSPSPRTARPPRAGEVASLPLREPTSAAGIRNSKSCTECRWKVSVLWLGNSVSPLTQGSSGEPLAVIPSSAHGERAQDPRFAPDDDACGLALSIPGGKRQVSCWGRRPSEPGDFALDLKPKRRKSNRDSVGPC